MQSRLRTWILAGLALLIVILLIAYFAGRTNRTTPSSSPSPSATASATSGATNSPAPSASSGALLQTKSSASAGSYLANNQGQALYTYDKDTSGVSNCSGSCLSAWPIYEANPAVVLPENVTTIKRSDGKLQYAYKGLPLYTFVSDPNGQATGNGIGGFHLARP